METKKILSDSEVLQALGFMKNHTLKNVNEPKLNVHYVNAHEREEAYIKAKNGELRLLKQEVEETRDIKTKAVNRIVFPKRYW